MDDGVLDQQSADLQDAFGIADRLRAAVTRSHLERVVVRERHRAELLGDRSRERLELEDLALEADPAGVEPREVEQVRGQPGQAGDLLAHRRQELAARVLVEVLVVHQLEEAAEREEGRPQLVGRVGDELLPGIVELGEAQPHAVEGAGKLAELVQAVIDHGRVEPSRRDAVRGALQALDPAREGPCAAVADAERHQQADEAGDQEAALDDVDRRVLRGERIDEQDYGAGRANRNGDLARTAARRGKRSRARPGSRPARATRPDRSQSSGAFSSPSE